MALSLFWVMTLGFESNLPTPLDSAAVMNKSTAKFGERCASIRPLVGAPAAKLVTRGSTGGSEDLMLTGGGGLLSPKLLCPTVGSPAMKFRPRKDWPANPSCV